MTEGSSQKAASRWSPTSAGFEMDIVTLQLAVTDQRDRGCGWVCHVSVEGQYGRETIHQAGGFEDATAAKGAAIEWSRGLCHQTLDALRGGSIT